MSNGNVVDSKIVELELNNSKFESNATTSLSTLEKLKKAFNFTSSSKNFEDMNAALHKIDVNSVTNSVHNLRGALNDLKSVVAFAWIADEAIKAKNAVEGFVKSVTVDQISAGFTKYGEKTSAVQTIMAATAKDFSDQGEQMEFVNGQLEKLNWFTDETSYNFLDMVSNIGKFTSNNVKLDQAVTSMQGISNWAAISGANVGEASRAMYNLSQAIAVGSVKLMDWKSIENANMATAEFKQTAIDTAVQLGTLKEKGDGLYETLKNHEVSVTNFNQSLSDEWFSSEVLLKTLDQYGSFTNELYDTMEALNYSITTSQLLEYVEDFKEGTLDLNSASKKAGVSADELKKMLSELGSEEFEFGLKAFKAAQEAKTFEEAVDSVKDAVSTGWMNTFEIMFGDYLQAKELWTGLANDLYEIFAEGGNTRNELLREAMDTTAAIGQEEWDKFAETGITSSQYMTRLREAVKDHENAVTEFADDEDWLKQSLERGVITVTDLETAYESLLSKVSGNVDKELLKQVEAAKDTDEEFAKLFDTIEKFDAADVSKVVFGDGTTQVAELEDALNGMLDYMELGQDKGAALVEVLQSMGYLGGVVSDVDQDLLKQMETAKESNDAFKELLGTLDKYSSKDIESVIFGDGTYQVEELERALDTMIEQLGLSQEDGQKMVNCLKEMGYFGGNAADAISKLSDEELRGLGFTEEQVKQLRKAVEEGKSVEAVLKELFEIKPTGRELWTESLTTSMQNLIHMIELVKSAWSDVFPSWTATGIYNIIESVHDAVMGFQDLFFVLDEDGNIKKFTAAGENLKAVFTGLFSILDLGIKTVHTLGSAGFTVLRGILDGLGIDILGILGTIGKLITGFHDWVVNCNILGKALDFVRGKATAAGNKVRGWVDSFLKLPKVTGTLKRFRFAFKAAGKSISPFFDGLKKKVDEFKAKIKELNGFKLENLTAIFKAFRETIVNYVKNFPGFKPVQAAFESLGRSIRGILDEYKIKLPSVSGMLTKFGNFAKLAFGYAGTAAKGAVGFVKDLFNRFVNLPKIQENLGRFKDGFKQAFGSIGDFFAGLKPRIDSFIDSVRKMGGLKLDTLADVFESFKNTIGSYFSNFQGFQGLRDAVKKLWDDISTWFSGTKIGAIFNDFLDRVNSFIDGVREAFEAFTMPKSIQDIFDFFKKDKTSDLESGADEAAGTMDTFSQRIYSAFDKIREALSGIRVKDIIRLATAFLLFKAVSFVFTALKSYEALIAAKANELNGRRLLEMAAALGILAAAVYALAQVPILDLIKGGLAIIALMAALTIMSRFFKGEDEFKGMKNAAEAMFILAGSLLLITVALKAMEFIDFKKSGKNLLGVLGVLAILGLVSVALKKWGADLGNGLSILSIIGSMFLMLALFKILESFHIDNVWNVVKNLGLLIAALAVTFKVIGWAAKDIEGSAPAILALGATFLLLSIAMKVVESVVKQCSFIELALIVGVMLGIAYVLKIILEAAKDAKAAALTIIALGVLFAILTAVLAVLALIPGPELLKSVGVLMLLMLGIDSVLYMLGKTDPKQALGNVLVMMLLMVAVGAVLWAMDALEIEGALENAEAISLVIIALAAAFLLISNAGPLAAAAIPIFGKFLALLGIAILVFGVVGALASLIPEGIRDKILSGCEFLVDVAKLLGEMIGEFLGGMVAGGMSVLPEIADAISGFCEHMQGVKPIDDAGVKSIKQVLLAMVGIDLVGLVGNILGSDDAAKEGLSYVQQFAVDIAALSEGLSTWAENMNSFKEINVPEDALDALIDSIGKINWMSFKGKLMEWVGSMLTGEDQSAVKQFSTDLTTLANSLKVWQDKMTEIGSITVPSEDISALADALGEVPGTGIFDKISNFFNGAPDFDAFKTNVTKLGEALASFDTAIGDDVDSAKISQMSDAVSSLADIGNKLSGQQLSDSWFSGEGILKKFAKAVIEFAEELSGLSDVTIDTESLSSFASSTSTLATATQTMSTVTIEGDIIDKGLIDKFKSCVQTLSDAISGLSGLDTSGVDKLTGAVDKLAAADISSAVDKLSSASSLGSGTDLSGSGEQMGSSLASGLSAQSGAMSSAMSGLVDSAKSAVSTNGFSDGGKAIAKALADGIAQSASLAADAMRQVVNSARNQAGGHIGGFYSAGSQMGAGFANGIAGSAFRAMIAARAMAVAALEAARAALRVHSPSKEAYEIGNFFGLGFTNAIDDNVGSAYDSGYGMADAARKGLHNAAKAVRDILTSDFDSSPVIRPVLDLSEIQNGASSIGNLLNSSPIPVTGNLSAIRGNVNARSMVTNGDVVSAISKLRNSLNNKPSGNTYVLDGITYDDGSNVASAIKSLVHATQVERRANG